MRSHTKEEREIIRGKIERGEINLQKYIYDKNKDKIEKKRKDKLLLLKPIYMKKYFG